MTWLILALLLPSSPADAVARLGAPQFAIRGAAQRYLVVACRRDQRLLATVERGLDSRDPEVRLRSFRVIYRIAPCDCHGCGWRRWGTATRNWWGDWEYTEGAVCGRCDGYGSPYLSPKRAEKWWPGKTPWDFGRVFRR